MKGEAAARLAGAGPVLDVELFFAATPQESVHRHLTLAEGATLWQALVASGLAEHLALDLDACRSTGLAGGLAMGIWGRLCGVDAPLQAGDRVELTRPLVVDPKEARRLRYRRDGLRKKQAPGKR